MKTPVLAGGPTVYLHSLGEGAAYPFLVAMAAEGPDQYPIMAPAKNRSRG